MPSLLRRTQDWIFPQRPVAWPIPEVCLEDFAPCLTVSPRGATPDQAIRFLPCTALGQISDFEAWVICTLARDAQAIFEFGTCTGRTTYLLAANAPKAEVVTLTLGPGQHSDYSIDAGDAFGDVRHALEESTFDQFVYEGTPEAARIVQLFGDSKALDVAPHLARYDVIFVDGSHAESYVRSDSEKALSMVKPGGLVLWHDYRGPEIASGVFTVLNELVQTAPLVRLRDTCFVALRA
jgi:hypothetical protein